MMSCSTSTTSTLVAILAVISVVVGHAAKNDGTIVAGDGSRNLRQSQQQATSRSNPNNNKNKKRKHKTKKRRRELAQTRVVGGSEVTLPNKYPFFGEWEEGCGGSLIHDDIFLTAAHCEATDSPFKKLTWFNSLLSGFKHRDTGVIRSTVFYQSHPGYNRDHHDHDILVVKLNASALVDANGQPTTVKTIGINANATVPHDGAPLTIIGTGMTSEGGNSSETLQEATLPYTPNNVCYDQYGPEFDGDLMMCAGVDGGGIDNCQGDSGSPIIDATSGLQVGIDSWGEGCARPDYYGVKARVSPHADWIYQQICLLSSYPPTSECQQRGFNLNPMPNMPTTGPGAITIRVGYDDYPEETAWFFHHVESHTDVYFQPFESNVEADSVLEKTFDNLPPGTYHFALGDGAGDGTCCEFSEMGSSLTDVSVNGDNQQVWSHKGDFGEQVHVYFDILDNGQVANLRKSSEYDASWEQVPAHPNYRSPEFPGAHPSDPTFAMAINIYYDMYPQETDWQLAYENVGTSGDSSWEAVHTSIGSDLNQETTNSNLITTQLTGLKTGWYRFAIRDSDKDGVCCESRYGWVTIVAPLVQKQGDSGVAWYNEGDFGARVDNYIHMNEQGIVDAVSETRPADVSQIRRGGGQRRILFN